MSDAGAIWQIEQHVHFPVLEFAVQKHKNRENMNDNPIIGGYLMIAIGCDHAGFEMKLALAEHLKEAGYTVQDFGTFSTESCDYPDFAKKVAEAVAKGGAEKGLLICGTGIGMSMAANKVKGIRAAVLSDEFSAQATREHNDANILCLGARVLDTEKAIRLLDIFMNTGFSNGENHIRRIGKLEN